MAATRKRLAGPALVTNASATKYTAPAGTTTEIRHIHISNPGAMVTVTISIGADAAGTRIADVLPVPAGSVLDLYGPYYLAATELIAAFASVTNQLTMTIDGIEYTAG